MQSSPYLPSSMPNQEVASDSVRVASIILAREEDLQGILLCRKASGFVLLTTWALEQMQKQPSSRYR